MPTFISHAASLLVSTLLVAVASLCLPPIATGEEPVSFRNDVLPVLSRHGCNSGACHGALAGKGGFRLSLRGYDPVLDYQQIVKHARGRRLDFVNPGESLLLTKPTGAVSHKGGVRFETTDDEYKILAQWISEGAAGVSENDRLVQNIQLLPEQSELKVGDKTELKVVANFTDGTSRDVTRWAKFTSANEAVAKIDEHGNIEVIGHGEAAFTAWYSSKIAIARTTSPFPNKLDPTIFEKSPRNNFIDEIVLGHLQQLNLPPSPLATDEEFLRRVFIDTIGRLPNDQETTQFLNSQDADKRTRIIDHLLERPEFIDYWAYKRSDILLVNGNLLRPEAVKSFYQWIRSTVESNMPWDQFARELVTARGDTLAQGATNFYSLHQDPETMSENVSQAFLGLAINCAKCHNHPLEKWTNDQYYAMANMFSRVRTKGWGGDPRNGDGNRTVFVVSKGELIQPAKGTPQPPTPLDGTPLAFDDPNDRRVALANWLTSPENPYFARSITNRIWANFLGIGLIEPIDDLRVSNPASNEKLLTELSAYLVAQKYDLKQLMRLILNSATYQRSSVPLPENLADKRYYSRYYPRRLMAEVLLDAVSDVTAVPTDFQEILFPGADTAKTDFYPKGTRALQLYDSAVRSYFLKAFGRNQREITCECERSNEPSMIQVLHIANGETVNAKLKTSGNRIDQWLEAKHPHAKIIELAYLSSLSRYPTADELTRLTQELETVPEAEYRTAIEDLLWGIMSSREFLFNR